MPSNVISQEVFSSTPFSFGPPAPVKAEEAVDDVQQPVLNNPIPAGDGGYDNYHDEDEFDQDYQEPQETDEEVEQDLDIDQKEIAGSLYDAFKTLGYITDEAEVPKVDNVTEFLVNYEKYKADKLDKTIREEYQEKYSEERLQYVDYLMKGGSPEAISSFYQLANLPIEDDEDLENRKALILAMYKDKGLNDKRAVNLYTTTYDEGEDVEEAKAAKEYFKEKHNHRLREIQEAEEQEIRQASEQNEQLVSTLKTILKEKKIVPLTDDEAKDLEPYMFGQNVLTDVLDPRTGQTYKGKVSQYYVDYQNFFKKPESLIKLAKFIRANGDKIDNTEEVKEKLSQELIIKLNGFQGKNNQKGSPKRKNAFLS